MSALRHASATHQACPSGSQPASSCARQLDPYSSAHWIVWMSETLSIWSSNAWDGWNAPVSCFCWGMLALGSAAGGRVYGRTLERGRCAVGRAGRAKRVMRGVERR